MSKRMRQQAIVELVSSQRVPSQAMLADELKKKGFEVTQATLSRDIAELNLVKSKEGYSRPQDASAGDLLQVPDPSETFRRLMSKIDFAGNMVVVKTSTGSASPVAIAIDESNYDQVVGTLAGDDTIFIVCRDLDGAQSMAAKIQSLIE